jgi:hypothetical protein
VFRWGLALGAYGAGSTFIYATSGFEIFVILYIATVLCCVVLTVIRTWTSPIRSQIWPFSAASVGFYAGGFLVLWLPEQLFCGNRVETSHDSVLLRLHVPLHAYFHITSALGPFCFLTYAAFSRLHQLGKRPTLRYLSKLEMGMLPLPVACVDGKAA